jgi:hypothetical protein
MKEKYEICTNEVDITMTYSIGDLNKLDKKNCKIDIIAKGDLPHHLIEGIVDCLKKIQRDNPHLEEI